MYLPCAVKSIDEIEHCASAARQLGIRKPNAIAIGGLIASVKAWTWAEVG